MNPPEKSVEHDPLINAAVRHAGEGAFDEAVADIQAILARDKSHASALKLLREIRERSAYANREFRGKQLYINRCLSFDDGVADRRILTAVAQLIDVMQERIAVFGTGRLTQYLLEHHPYLSRSLKWIVGDGKGTNPEQLAGLHPIDLEAMPPSIEAVFFSTVDLGELQEMKQRLDKRFSSLKTFSLAFIEHLDFGAVPKQAWGAPAVNSIYPMDIPTMNITSGVSFLLLELPPRQIPVLPYGVGYVHNALAKAGIDVQTFDFNIVLYHRFNTRILCEHKSTGHLPPTPGEAWENFSFDRWMEKETLAFFSADIEEFVNAIVKAAPKIVGISLHHPTRALAERVVADLRCRLPKVVIIVGGYDCVSETMARSKFTDFDYMVIGEAELTLPPLVKRILNGEQVMNTPGVISKFDAEDVPFSPGTIPGNLDALGFPTYDWFDFETYRLAHGEFVIPFSISRGCAWGKCNFCAERFCFRTRSVASIMEEFRWFYERGCTNFMSMESDVNGDPAFLEAICSEIVRSGMALQLYAQVRIDKHSDRRYFELLRRAGFNTLVFGVDGWNNHTLKLQRKGYNMRLVEQNLTDCSAAGIFTNVNMVSGVPGETDEDVKECIANIVALKDRISIFSTINMLRLVPGSPYYETPEKFNIHFRGDRAQIYSVHPIIIPEHLWFSEEPYIDHDIRVARYQRLCKELLAAGVRLGDFAMVENAKEIERIKAAKGPATSSDAYVQR